MKLLTLENLYQYYTSQNKDAVFNANNGQDSLYVQIEERMSAKTEYDPTWGFLKTHLQSCHILDNRNGSYISEESMNTAIPSFYNRPILGYIHQLKDGSYDFAGHEFDIDENGEMVYKEIPIGTIPESCNAQLVYDKDKDKTYLEVDGLIYEEYTRAAEILRDKKQCKVSVELSIDALSYSADTKLLNIDEFHFMGVTILGTTDDEYEEVIEEGMLGSNITLADFSKQNNSLVYKAQNLLNAMEDFKNQLAMAIDDTQLSTTNMEGGKNEMSKFDELLAKYNKTVDDITFDYADLSDEELEKAFADAFVEVEDNNENEDNDDSDDINNDENTENEDDNAEENEEPEAIRESLNDDVTISFQVSHDDIRNGLYNLISQYDELDNDWYWIEAVYDDYFIMSGYRGNIYKQSYSVDEEDNIRLEGDRVKLYVEYLTESEKVELDSMRENYSVISSQLQAYQNAELKTQKQELLQNPVYDNLRNDAEFTALVSSVENGTDNSSLSEFEQKCDAILVKYTKANYSVKTENKLHTSKLLNNVQSNKKTKRYGTLFD